ncbi:MAG: calcium/sodium antiporter [Bacteroidaceae bacterium]|nr:calcium/sodium antiporter [Bacteroidaceae bacterium]
MLPNLLLLILSIALILFGADRLTEGASVVSRRMGVSEMVVGLTVVSFGTSMPEFVVSMTGALTGASDISVGNIIGSNLFNALVIVGCSALACPIAISNPTVRRDMPFALLSTLLLVVLISDTMLTDTQDNLLTRLDGFILMLAFALFMLLMFVDKTDEEETAMLTMPLWGACLWIVVGLACLVLGGELFVDNATALAREWGVSEMFIGLTIAAGGTSLPELATSIVAARKGHSAMAIGNVVGSNVFNILFILGACSLVSPLSVNSVSVVDIALLVFSMVALWIFATSDLRISRTEGLTLILIYVGYVGYRIFI